MGMYRSFLFDFPKRCSEIISGIQDSPVYKKYDVTTLLALGGLAIIQPHERVSDVNHPSSDGNNYIYFFNSYNELMQECFLGSKLWPFREASSIKYYKDYTIEAHSHFEHTIETVFNNSKSLSQEKKVSNIVNHLRNALAHGNIFFTEKEGLIDRIAFLSRRSEPKNNDSRVSCKYAVLFISPADFKRFFENWLRFLNNSHYSEIARMVL